MSLVLVAGGGMAGLAAARVVANAGWATVLLERAAAFAEVGAGLQLGPNATRVLAHWGLMPELRRAAAFPRRLCVRDARDGRLLASGELNDRVLARYGHPYATVHRADLHALLRGAALRAGATCLLRAEVRGVEDRAGQPLAVHDDAPRTWQPAALLGCDGLWSTVRSAVWQDGPPRFTGHLAFRGLLGADALPGALRPLLEEVTVWLGPRLHAVHYPVRAGAALNLVAVVHGPRPADEDAMRWDREGTGDQLRAALQRAGAEAGALKALVEAVPAWGLWPLHDREPLTSAAQQASGRVALLGDAAHPMRPYLAQGAAMALEDAHALGEAMAASPVAFTTRIDWATVLQAWAQSRWARNAWVQRQSRRNGAIFHARGPLRWARNAALGLAGARLLDQPRLYGA